MEAIMAEEKIVEFEEDGKKKHKGKGSKVSSFVLGIVNAIIFVFTVVMYVLVGTLDLEVENAAAIIAVIFVYIIMYVFPIMFSIANIAIGIPGIITGAVGLKRSEKKGFALVALILNIVIIAAVLTLFILTYVFPVIGPAN